jgi:hypothetical protein
MLNRVARTVSIAALTVSVSFVARPVQQASAQFLTGVGSSSVSILIDNWFDPAGGFADYAITGSGVGRDLFNTAQGPDFAVSLTIPLGADINNNGGVPLTAGETVAIDADGNGILDEPIININPVSVTLAFPANIPYPDFPGFFFAPRFTSVGQLCEFLSGSITSYNQLVGDVADEFGNIVDSGQLGPNLAPTLVYRSDVSGINSSFDELIEPLCTETEDFNGNGVLDDGEDRNFNGVLDVFLDLNGNGSNDGNIFDLSDIGGAVLSTVINRPDTVGASSSQDALITIATIPGAIGYENAPISSAFGFVAPSYVAGLLPQPVDVNRDGFLGPVDFNGDGDFFDRFDFNNDGDIIHPGRDLNGNGVFDLGIDFPPEIESFGQGEFGGPIGIDIGIGPIFVGFYQNYPNAVTADAAGNLCLYLTQGLDFDGNGIIDVGESGRLSAISFGYAIPRIPELDPNCGLFFPGFSGRDVNGDGLFTGVADIVDFPGFGGVDLNGDGDTNDFFGDLLPDNAPAIPVPQDYLNFLNERDE